MLDPANEFSKLSSNSALVVEDLKVVFHTYAGTVKALDGIDIVLKKREILGLVGESGCGKTVTALSIACLLPPTADVQSGKILLGGQDLLTKKKEDIRISRVTEIAMVFQDPLTYLDPLMNIGKQITEIFTHNLDICKKYLIDSRLEDIQSSISVTKENDKNARLETEKK